MKISVILCVLLLTACGNEKTRSSPVVVSPSPSSMADVGPISQNEPQPSVMPSTTASPSPSARSSQLPTSTPNSLDSSILPSSLAMPSAVGKPRSPSNKTASAAKPSNQLTRDNIPVNNSDVPHVVASKGADKSDDNLQKATNLKKLNTITVNSIGIAKIGMTFGELKKSLAKGITLEVKDNFAVDFSAIAVKKQGKVQFYIPYTRKNKLGDEDAINYLVTDNPIYKTEQGVRPGMTIKQAARIYGPAKLILSRDNASKEIIRFAKQPADLTFYGVRSGDQNLAGIYPESNDAVLETDRYSDRAKIGEIIVACQPETCEDEH